MQPLALVVAIVVLDAAVDSPDLMGRTMIGKGMIYNQGKEMLVIPLGSTATDGSNWTPSPFASCRAIRVGR